MASPVWHLLRRNISVGQLAGYAIANLVGLTIVLVAVQFLRDAHAAQSDDTDSFVNRDYMVISKRVSAAGMLLGESTIFTPEEIAEIEDFEWVDKVGRFTPSRFNVFGRVDLGGQSMSSYLFFESIPDEFFDNMPRGWKFDPENPDEVPIILSKDYLTLYNFGFAASQGLPQLSENLITKVPLRISISGNGRQIWLDARIAGFSQRLNTIAVPEDFMRWANENYADPDKKVEVSRLILQVNDPGNPAIIDFLEDRGIEVAGDKVNNGRTAYFFSVMSAVVVTIGVIISALAFFILTLSITLLLQKNKDKIHDLLLLGYTPRSVSRHYYMLVATLNAMILLGACVAASFMRGIWSGAFHSLGLGTTSCWLTIVIGCAIMVVLTTFNVLAIRKIVVRTFYS